MTSSVNHFNKAHFTVHYELLPVGIFDRRIVSLRKEEATESEQSNELDESAAATDVYTPLCVGCDADRSMTNALIVREGRAKMG